MKKKILLVDDEPDFFYNPERIRTQEDQIQMICGLRLKLFNGFCMLYLQLRMKEWL
jgi:hypothetical protein